MSAITSGFKVVLVVIVAGVVAKAAGGANRGGKGDKPVDPPTKPVSIPAPQPGDGTKKPDPIRTGNKT